MELVTRAYVAVCDDLTGVREGVRQELVEYMLSPPYASYVRSVGFGADVDRVTRAFAARRDVPHAAAGVSDALLDEVLISGRNGSEVSDRLRAYFDAGADDLMVQCVSAARGGGAPGRTLEAVAAALGHEPSAR